MPTIKMDLKAVISPKVSILIPTYNRAAFLREALCSALAQTHHDIEVLVLDDDSSDDTPLVAHEFSGDVRLRYIRHPQNLGIAGNWKAGIAAATGEFFCILHDDDTFEKNFVETLVRPLLEDSNLILAFCDHWAMDADGQRLYRASDEVSGRFKRAELRRGRLVDFAYTALVDSSIPVGATLFRKSMVSEEFINEQAQGSIDAWLFYQCVKTGYGAYYMEKRLMNYRTHPGGMSTSSPLYMAEGHLFRYRSILADPHMAVLHSSIRQMMPGALADYGVGLLAVGRQQEAQQVLKESLRLRVSLRSLVAFALAYGGGPGTKLTATLRKVRRLAEQGSSEAGSER
jgi:glycosyltransferase involved in cell wall biosynthesis